MPNGGPDCCGNCAHNRAVQEMAHPHPEQQEKFWELSFCTLRGVNISNPFWTYCANFRYGSHPEERNREEEPLGFVFASGLYEGYVRIPWDGSNEPTVSCPATCKVCGRVTDRGIVVERDGSDLGFCTNRHYIQWWNDMHGEDFLDPNDFQSPDERYAPE